ncbi:MAG TPA: hypothetical protein PKI32_01505 [Opitutales bacterium]|nr:hypothetical protein [Opitutales bacterium]
MKSYLQIALIAVLALLPSSMLSAAPISDSLQQAVDKVVATPDEGSALFTALVSAIQAEVDTQGFSSVADIADQIMRCATDENTAALLAKAVSRAIISKAKATPDVDVSSVAFAIGAGVSSGVSAAFKDVAVEAAADAATAVPTPSDPTLGDDVRAGASSKGEIPGIEPPLGDAGFTPAADISTGTGVSGD